MTCENDSGLEIGHGQLLSGSETGFKTAVLSHRFVVVIHVASVQLQIHCLPHTQMYLCTDYVLELLAVGGYNIPGF